MHRCSDDSSQPYGRPVGGGGGGGESAGYPGAQRAFSAAGRATDHAKSGAEMV